MTKAIIGLAIPSVSSPSAELDLNSGKMTMRSNLKLKNTLDSRALLSTSLDCIANLCVFRHFLYFHNSVLSIKLNVTENR